MSKQIHEQYQVVAKAGEGTYGVVFKAVSRRDPLHVVAIKEMRHDDQEEGVPSSALREIALLLELDHPNVVKLHDVVNDVGLHRLFLVFEYLDGDLYRLMQANHMAFQSDVRLAKYYTWQMLQGLEYLHSRRVIHRDLKPQNLLIARKGNVLKLGDFGLARAMGVPIKGLSPEVVTIWYRAPELLLGYKTYTAAVDIWSVGCIFAEMATGRPLFPGMRELEQLNRIYAILGTPDEEVWPGVGAMPGARVAAQLPHHSGAQHLTPLLPKLGAEGVDLLRGMLMLDPAQRLTARGALRHAFFRDMGGVVASMSQITPSKEAHWAPR